MKKRKSPSLSRLSIFGVIANYALAAIAPRHAVRRLVSALGSDDEDTATAAYMVLVKLGPRMACHLLSEAHAGRQTVSVLEILGDQGDERIIPELEEFARSPDPSVASAARVSLETLHGRSHEDES